MKRLLSCLLAAGLLVTAGPAGEDASKKDLAALQGDWAAVSFVIDGTKLSDDEAQSIFRTIKGNEYTLFLFSKPLTRGTFQIDAAKKPRAIDVLAADGPAKGKTVLGIYELQGDRLQICTAQPGKDRPADFLAKKGSGHTLQVWEREKK
jgi:uncharacterized protein (TIGR03067 family)